MTDRQLDPAADPRPLVRRLAKPPVEWQRQDLVELCCALGIRVVNLRYPSLDGKLRELRVPVAGRGHLDRLLAGGERVDGSSLFPGLFDTGASDLYVVPVYRWAFLDPFADDELDVVCRFAGRDGAPCSETPDSVLAGAAERFRRTTGAGLEALAELEYYLVLERADDHFPGRAQRGYQQSAPYLHGRPVADDVLRRVASVTGRVKYAHAEVGVIDRMESSEPELHGRRVEQHELELDLMPVEDLGCWLSVARWLIRATAARHGASATFVPKLEEGMAGSGMHLHLAVTRDGDNAMGDGEGGLSTDALGLIGGLLARARPLTAFGNTVAASYLRLVPGQEAPTRVCWGAGNRASLIRVPLDFATSRRLDLAFNPGEQGPPPAGLARPTVEYRSPDGSAYPHLLLAAVTLTAADGVAGGAGRELAERLRVDGGDGDDDHQRLPATAVAAARCLDQERGFFESGGFPPRLIDRVVASVAAESDDGLAARLRALPAAERLREGRKLMHKDLHKH